jgi:hypothetical protein
VRTTNPIESTFATVRHRTSRARNCLSRATFLAMAFKLIEAAEKSWRKIRGAENIEALLKGIPFKKKGTLGGGAVSHNSGSSAKTLEHRTS